MDDNKKIIIIAVCCCCLLMTMIIACSKGCGKKEDKKVVVVPKQNFINNEDEEIKDYKSENSYSSPIRSSGSSSYSDESSGTPPALLTEEEKAEMAKSLEKDIEKINQLKKEWFEKKLKESDNSKTAFEQMKLRSNPSFLKGMNAIEQKDFDTAILSFNEILKDNNATPVSKYFACSKLMDVAMEKKDIDLYFIAARMRANLIMKDDLEVLGIEKDEDAMEWVDKVENTLKARNDKKYYDICVQLKMREIEESGFEVDAETRTEIEQSVDHDIKYYSDLYKELIE